MDVDLLRPGTVPISPDTVLWFEFLLDPSLLEKHLKKHRPDPPATDLIISFLSIAAERKDDDVNNVSDQPQSTKAEESSFKKNRKCLALKILALKVAAYLKWDLDILESKLPLPMQVTLLESLLLLALDNEVDVGTHSEMDITQEPSHVVFAVNLYHRWVLRALIQSKLSIRQNRLPNVPIPGLQEPGNVPLSTVEEILRRLESQVIRSIGMLCALMNVTHAVVPVFDSFTVLTEDSKDIKQEWCKGIPISADEFLCQLHFDLGCYYLFREQRVPARENMDIAANLFEKLRASEVEFFYCNVNEQVLNGYCEALELTTSKRNLLSQLHRSIHNQYTGIVSTLQQDNTQQEIPGMYRDVLELDIQGAVSSGKFTVARDLLFQVQALNVVNRAVKGLPIYTNFWSKIQGKPKALDILFNAIVSVLPTVNDSAKQRLKQLLFLGVADCPLVAEWVGRNVPVKALFTVLEVEKLDEAASKSGESGTTEVNATAPQLLLKTDWDLTNFEIQDDLRLESGSLEQQLIRSYNAKEIHGLLVKLVSLNPGKVIWKINNKWELPIPLQGVVTSLPRGLIQDNCYILLAKARELTAVKDFSTAQNFLSVVEKDATYGGHFSSNLAYKLIRLVSWESLLVQIFHFHSQWPSSGVNTEALMVGCKQCLSTLKSGDNVIPRLEVLEQCALCLLNLGQWEYLSTLEKRWNYFELTAALASACYDVARFKGNKKVCKDAWDMVLPVFGPSLQQKRSSSGASMVMHRDSPTHCSSPVSRASLFHVLASLRDPTVLSVAISLLARLHNVLRDEPTLELSVEYSGLWPAVVSNANSYHARAVSEMLTQLLVQALCFHPSNTSWLKLLADLNFVMGHYAVSLRCYLEVGLIVSDFFSQPLPRSVMDDHVYRRMIKCCSQLQCHTQAAVLCQFLEEVDYATAFKSLGDAKSSSSCSDGMEAYYNCIWDITILEFLVHLHCKRGETQRKQQAIKVIGLLELNASNNEEIQREAANVRKARFMRAMARQYLN